MNRIKICPDGTSPYLSAKTKPNNQTPQPSGEKTFSPIEDESFSDERAIFLPLHYEKNYAYPLIIWLHDNGSDQNYLPDVMFDISIRNYLAVAPRGPENDWDSGYCWPQTTDCVYRSMCSIQAAMDEVRSRFNIDSQRIYIGGTGGGGTMAFRLACMQPELFAGIISLNGPFPEEQAPLSQYRACRELPVFWAHSRKSESFAEADLCAQLRLLHIAGFSVTLRQYPCGDELTAQMFNDINVWIMDAINGTDELTQRSTV